jgi:LmbE family N-acetylglucosaminyl deacetylase
VLDRRAIERALCVSAHPDDEVLGAGATLATLADRGVDVHVLILGEGVGGRYGCNRRPDDDVASLAEDARAAAQILGVSLRQLALPDHRFDSVPLLDVVHAVEEAKAEVDPDVVFTHHPGDLNVDHVITCNAVLTAFRPTPAARPATILACETLSSTEWSSPASRPPFIPNVYVDAEAGLDRKVAAMAKYRSEVRDWPHPRSERGIVIAARRWGMNVGLAAAEAFVLLRQVTIWG